LPTSREKLQGQKMKRLRIRVIILIIWLILFYMLTIYWQALSVSPFTHFFVLIITIAMLITPEIRRKNIWWVLAVPVVAFIGIKAVLEPPLLGAALAITAMESTAILLTTLLLLWVREATHEFEHVVKHLTIGQLEKITETAVEGKSMLYREVRRARNHQRPLSLLAIAIDEKSIKESMEKIVQEAQHSILRQFALASVSKSLCGKLEDCDIVVQSNDHFLVVLPETKAEDLPGLIERLRKLVAEEVGVDIKIGTASLPQDSFTFEGLLEKATLEMQESMNDKLFIDAEQLFIKRKTT
jgi:GGDEF domain-containing protein